MHPLPTHAFAGSRTSIFDLALDLGGLPGPTEKVATNHLNVRDRTLADLVGCLP